MEQSQINRVRHFNREYVQLLGLLDRQVFDTELPFPEARLLLMVFETPALRPIDVASTLRMDKGYVSRLVIKLEKRGLVTKVPSRSDGRSKLIQLTEEGRELAQTIDADSNQQVSQLFDSLAPADQAAALAAITTLQQLLLK